MRTNSMAPEEKLTEEGKEMPLLEVRHLSKQYKGFSLEDISFTLPEGYIMGYVGPNGSGKTTTLSLITQIIRASGGEVLLDGRHYKEEPLLYKEKIGYVSAMPYFPLTMKIKDIAVLCGYFYPTFQKGKFYQMVREWNLPENKRLSKFSGGMIVKLMFASALARETRLLVLDEATNGLDILFREEILRLLQRYIEDGRHSVLFATHIIDDLEQVADYIVMIEDGKILLQDTKEALTENYILLRGSRELMEDAAVKSCLIGIKRSSYEFSALMKADDALALPSGTVMEKPSVSQIMSHMMKKHEELLTGQ